MLLAAAGVIGQRRSLLSKGRRHTHTTDRVPRGREKWPSFIVLTVLVSLHGLDSEYRLDGVAVCAERGDVTRTLRMRQPHSQKTGLI